MRASILLVVVLGLFACSHAAIDLDGLKEAGTSLVSGLVDQLKSKAVEIGKQFLGSLLEKFGKREEVTTTWKDRVKGLIQKFGTLVDHVKSKAKDTFGKALTKLHAVVSKVHEKMGLLKDAKQMKDEVDDVVAEHHVAQKRIISDLIQKGKDFFGGLLDKAKELASSVKAKASDLVSGLLQKGTDMLVGKRATLSDHLQTIGGVLSGAVSPFKDIVAGLGNTLKGHFSNLVDTVKGHVTALKGKLSGHVDDLKTHGKTLLDHGKNALGALGEVVSDILKQTLSNAQPAIDGLAGTAAGAGKTILDHFAGAN